ncbi:Elongation factor TS [Popillia japonica]|uniref:Elongation factor Ts, mitochondrial n=1 Tax=Popillia japonica TaxID=7064 RepID=A0AAW1L4N3_POPJA
MMLRKQIARYLHVGRPCFAVEKALLAKLRKKTGYTFTNCKKALEMHENDITKAENWLKEQAQQLGWAKASKLEGRQAIQGVIAVTMNNQSGALVELNCETDFVARNEVFKNMAELAATTILKFAETQQHSNEPVRKIGLDVEQINQLKALDGKPLGDHVALMIGTLGENASLRRAMVLTAAPSLIGGIVALRQCTTKNVDLSTVGKNICQHIVGMNPKRVGTSTDEPSKNSDEETCLIFQEYLNDESIKVKDYLEENGVEVVDFKRFECGECSRIAGQSLEFVETLTILTSKPSNYSKTKYVHSYIHIIKRPRKQQNEQNVASIPQGIGVCSITIESNIEHVISEYQLPNDESSGEDDVVDNNIPLGWQNVDSQCLKNISFSVENSGIKPEFFEMYDKDENSGIKPEFFEIDNEGADTSIRLYKLTSLLEQLIPNFQKVLVPGEELRIDETLVPFRGRISFRQYIKNKKHKFGVKLYKLCLNGGYTYDLQIYCGTN